MRAGCGSARGPLPHGAGSRRLVELAPHARKDSGSACSRARGVARTSARPASHRPTRSIHSHQQHCLPDIERGNSGTERDGDARVGVNDIVVLKRPVRSGPNRIPTPLPAERDTRLSARHDARSRSHSPVRGARGGGHRPSSDRPRPRSTDRTRGRSSTTSSAPRRRDRRAVRPTVARRHQPHIGQAAIQHGASGRADILAQAAAVTRMMAGAVPSVACPFEARPMPPYSATGDGIRPVLSPLNVVAAPAVDRARRPRLTWACAAARAYDRNTKYGSTTSSAS